MGDLVSPSDLDRVVAGFTALLEGGDFLRKLVLGNGEVFRAKASYVVPLVISHGHVELDQDDVYAEMQRIVLGRGPTIRLPCNQKQERKHSNSMRRISLT